MRSDDAFIYFVRRECEKIRLKHQLFGCIRIEFSVDDVAVYIQVTAIVDDRTVDERSKIPIRQGFTISMMALRMLKPEQVIHALLRSTRHLLYDVVRHEVDEMIMHGGVRVFDPHVEKS